MAASFGIERGKVLQLLGGGRIFNGSLDLRDYGGLHFAGLVFVEKAPISYRMIDSATMRGA